MKKYYEDKRYVIGKRGTYFIVKIEDLPNKIKVKNDN